MDTPERLTAEDRRRVGAKLRGLRVERRLDQVDVARDAGISVGTLQMIERGSGRDVRPANLDKVARVLETSVDALRTPSQTRRDPLLADLNQEDLVVAREFHNAILDVKVAVRGLLERQKPEAERARFARLIVVLLRGNPDLIAGFADVVMNATKDEPATPTRRKQVNGQR